MYICQATKRTYLPYDGTTKIHYVEEKKFFFSTDACLLKCKPLLTNLGIKKNKSSIQKIQKSFKTEQKKKIERTKFKRTRPI